MTKEPGTTATSSTGRPVEPEPGAATGGATPRADRPARRAAERGTPAPAGPGEAMLAPGAAGFAVIAVLWLAAMLWSGQRSITSANIDSIAISMTALSLPGVISASLLSGAAMGLTATNLLARRGIVRIAPRFAAAVAAGLVTGLLAALAVALSYGSEPANMVLAGAIAAAATIGGAAGGLRAAPAVGAIVAATLVVFAVSYALGRFEHPLLSLYGSGATDESKLGALEWFSRTGWLLGGLAAGLVAFGYLRWDQRRLAARDGDRAALRWPWYLVAGAGPGLLLLATEVLTWTAGRRVIELAKALSDADSTTQGWLGNSRFNNALGVLFLGAFTALIAFGRTLRPAAEPEEAAVTAPSATRGGGPAGGGTAPEPAGRTPADQTPDELADDDLADDDGIGAVAGAGTSTDDRAANAGW